MLIPWFRKLFMRRPTTHVRPGKRVGRLAGLRLSVEGLEDRTVPTFLAPVNFAAGTAPAAITAGDFNGDGRADLAVVNDLTLGTVSVLLSNGDGTFQVPVTSADWVIPNLMVTGDFNGDGKLDLATSGTGTTTISVLMGNGDGTFQAPVGYQLGAAPTHLAAGDFNGDGRVDLVASSTGYGGTLFELKNAGDGTFLPVQNYAAGFGAQDVEAVDLNNDGKLDLITANQVSGGTVSTLLGNGDGTFQSSRSYLAGSAPYRETVADFNHDGNIDVAVLNSYTSNQMSILLGNGDGSFKQVTAFALTSGFNDIQAADFNGDGNLDLVESNGQVELGRGDGTFYAASSYAGFVGNGVAVADFNGDGALDVAGSASTGNVEVLTNAANDTAMLGGAVALSISTPATVTAGAPFAVTVSAIDANGNVVTGFLGTVGFNSTNPAYAAQAFSYTFTAADAGTHTIPNAMTLFTAGVQSFSVTSPMLPTATQSVMVDPAAGTHFAVSAPVAANAGDPVSVTVTALDAYGNVAKGYTRSVSLRSSDARAGLPAAYTFTADDASVHTFTVILKTAGAQTVTATDTLTGSISGTSVGIAVSPTAATSLSLIGGGGYIASSHLVTVSARDIYGNVATSYNGTVHLGTSDAQATVSGDAALVNGVGSFTVTPMTLGAQTISAVDVSDASIAGSESVFVTPGQGVKFVVTPLAGATAGTAQSMTVTVYDILGDVSTVYNGTVVISSSDPQASASYYTFTAADAGVHTFTINLKTAGSQSVTVADVVNGSLTSSQSGIVVTPAAAASLLTTAYPATTAGVANNVTVTLRDVYGNTAAGYRGTIAITSSDTQAALPAAYTFTAADAGSHTFSIALKSSGGQTLNVQDIAGASLTSFQRDIPVSAAAMAGFSFRGPSNATAGTAFTVTLSAVDAYGNTVAGYRGKVHFTGPGGTNSLPLDYLFTAADAGSHTFSVTLTSLGGQVINVQDTGTGTLKGSMSVTVKTGGTGGSGGVRGGGGGGGGKRP